MSLAIVGKPVTGKSPFLFLDLNSSVEARFDTSVRNILFFHPPLTLTDLLPL